MTTVQGISEKDRDTWRSASVVWVEDDALTPDRESLDVAWRRVYGVDRSTETIARKVDDGDAVFVFYWNGRIACESYPGNGEIRERRL
jgi:hypothetical protein